MLRTSLLNIQYSRFQLQSSQEDQASNYLIKKNIKRYQIIL